MTFSNLSFGDFRKRRSPLFWIAFSLCILLLIAQVGERVILHHMEREWPSVYQEQIQTIYSTVQNTFDVYQDEAVQSAKKIASSPGLMKEILGGSKPDQRHLFDLLQRVELKPETSVEIYDSSGVLLAWWGRTAGLQHRPGDVKRETSFVSQGVVYSYLSVVVPVTEGSRGYGSVVLHKIFDVNYPLSNRFISSTGFAQTFPRLVALHASFDFSHLSPRKNSEDIISIPLHGITGATIGFAYLDRPEPSTFLDEVDDVAKKITSLFLVGLTTLLFYSIGKAVHRSPSLPIRSLGITALLWVTRYGWLWIGFPSYFFSGSVFDPRYFASPFGFGIAKSIGELFLTSAVLCVNICYLVYQLLPRFLNHASREQGKSSFQKLFAFVSLPVLAFLLFLFHRGLTATVRSAIFDSSLPYADPTTILPEIELAVMLLSLGLIVFSFVAASVLIIAAGHRVLAALYVGSTWLPLIALFVIFGIVGILFGVWYPNPLVGHFSRLAVASGFFLLVAYLVRIRGRTGVFHGRNVFLGIVATIVILVLQLDDQIHQRERKNIELLAVELSKPVDAWLSFVVDQSLREMSGDEAAQTLMSNDPDELGRLAFTQWAKGILSKEGYNCGVMFLDAEGHLVSSFRIGARRLEPFSSPLKDLYLDSYAKTPITVSEQKDTFGKRKIYSGSAVIADNNGAPVGTVAVVISAGEQSFFRGEATPILRSYGGEESERYLRKLIVSEFVDGKLTYSTAEDVALRDQLSSDVTAQLTLEGSVWVDEQLDSREYETLYFRIPGGNPGNAALALSWKKADWRWHLFAYLRLVLLYILVLFVGTIAILLVWYLRGRRFGMSFRSKLLLAFFIVSLVPVVVIAYYNREITIEAANQSIIERLSSETSTLRTRMMRELSNDYASRAEFIRNITDDWCEGIATEVATDFSIYLDGEEKASSKPELFETEILNRRLSGETFSHVVLERSGFYAENQIIGNYAYLVGYRPVIASSGKVLCVLAVPILYKQLEIVEELARRNALLFGAYAMVLVLAAVAGTIFASQISYPIRQLIAATRRIANGELDFQLSMKRTDEVGELHQAFNKMTSDLKQNRNALVKAERELAWKEMAKQVAHEIKNPLTPMKLSIQHLRQAFHDNQKAFGEVLEEVTQTIIGQIEALSRIASQFAHFARMPERQEGNIDIDDVLSESAKLFQEYRGVTIHMHRSPEPLIVYADREEIRRAFINIIRNAVQAMEEQGSITLVSKGSDAKIQIQISDTGPGIPEEIQHRLYEPNFSTKSEGMGLGLALVKKTIDDLHGTIDIQSKTGSGTTVTITLPRKRQIST